MLECVGLFLRSIFFGNEMPICFHDPNQLNIVWVFQQLSCSLPSAWKRFLCKMTLLMLPTGEQGRPRKISWCPSVSTDLRSANFSTARPPRHTRGCREREWPTKSGELRNQLLSHLDGFLCCSSGDFLSYQGSSNISWLCSRWVIPKIALSRKNGEQCVACKTPCDCSSSHLCRLGDFVCLCFFSLAPI